MSLCLAEKIKAVYPDGFNSYFILGNRSIGKTSYALFSLYEALLSLGYSEKDAWKKALFCLRFKMVDVIDFFETASSSSDKEICLIWDDVRVHAGGTKYFSDYRAVEKLRGLMDVARTLVSTIIFTCPSTQGILGFLTSYDDHSIKIHYSKKGGWYREAHAYLWSSLPSGKRYITKKWIDNYSCYMPKDIYNIYMDKRKEATKELIASLKKSAKEEY